MIILDTNVLAALMRMVPELSVVAWLDRQPAESIWITSITLFEARFGLELLPAGRRRQALEGAFARMLKDDLETACWISTAPPRLKQHRWRPRGRRMGGRWTCATRKSRASCSRGTPCLPRETYGILGI